MRQFEINGQPLLIRAGGWSENLFLRYSAANTAEQIALIKNLGLNGIRTEGKEMPEDFYEQMDRAGILIDAGFQCCDAWQPEHRKPKARRRGPLRLGAHDRRAIAQPPQRDRLQLERQRAHPRAGGVSLAGFADADFQDPLIASAEYQSARSSSGPQVRRRARTTGCRRATGTTPRTIDHTIPRAPTSAARGALTARQAPATPCPRSTRSNASCRRSNRNSYGRSRPTTSTTPTTSRTARAANGGYCLRHAVRARPGDRRALRRHWSSLDEYVEDAQVQNYETQRAQFEAYIDHANATPTPSTGIVYWQLNKGWPTLLWDLYNRIRPGRQPTSARRRPTGPCTCCTPTTPDRWHPRQPHRCDADGPDGGVEGLHARRAAARRAERRPDHAGRAGLRDRRALAPDPGRDHAARARHTYFVELLLRRGGSVIDRNVYWLSTQPDLVDWPRTVGNPQAAVTRYSSFQQLQSLPAATVIASAQTSSTAGDEPNFRDDPQIRPTDPSCRSVLRADVRHGTASEVGATGGR